MEHDCAWVLCKRPTGCCHKLPCVIVPNTRLGNRWRNNPFLRVKRSPMAARFGVKRALTELLGLLGIYAKHVYPRPEEPQSLALAPGAGREGLRMPSLMRKASASLNWPRGCWCSLIRAASACLGRTSSCARLSSAACLCCCSCRRCSTNHAEAMFIHHARSSNPCNNIHKQESYQISNFPRFPKQVLRESSLRSGTTR